ncbi:hypothetical protein Fmac_008963 [Flemingia macrophylla]|uniref:Uncharacterized protein n=1 Tax=Flemingia macrophylla TaxID=520843 RepID=A0ABD1MYX4_9FABA
MDIKIILVKLLQQCNVSRSLEKSQVRRQNYTAKDQTFHLLLSLYPKQESNLTNHKSNQQNTTLYSTNS